MTPCWALAASALATMTALACTTAGSVWMAQPLPGEEEAFGAFEEPAKSAPPSAPRRTQHIGNAHATPVTPASKATIVVGAGSARKKLVGNVLGKFRNTYYDFPSEGDYEGEPVSLMDPSCNPIRNVARGFYEAVCVQGSGTLSTGMTVSFAKRDCECAAICPRTDQKICFDALDPKQFPWGRGATGKAITPLLTVAVDSDVIPLGTALYIPELDGAPREVTGETKHDGCFIAQDRGVRVKGKHVDIFTGHESMTKLWNTLFPSNDGVTVVLKSPRCERIGDITNMYKR
jgi:3D (Asp-Asp-Asp) domain-containing protein